MNRKRKKIERRTLKERKKKIRGRKKTFAWGKLEKQKTHKRKGLSRKLSPYGSHERLDIEGVQKRGEK